MLDDLNPREGKSEPGRDRPRSVPSRPFADREVPRGTRRTPQTVQAWLDGDLPEAAVRRGDTARDVDFWRRIESEVDKRRRMKTPAYVQERIMQALPQATPRVITPFWRRQFAVTPTMAVAVGAAMLALGVLLTSLILSR